MYASGSPVLRKGNVHRFVKQEKTNDESSMAAVRSLLTLFVPPFAVTDIVEAGYLSKGCCPPD